MTFEPPEDPIAALRARLARTQEAVDRLTAETAKARAAQESEAAAGPAASGPSTTDAAAEAQALVTLLHTARNLIPEELWEQLADVIRQLLLIVRALLDWWIARLGPAPAGDAPIVQDIPVL